MIQNEFPFEPWAYVLPKHIHLIGVGGDGMSALAALLLGRGYVVSGSEQAAFSRTKQPEIVTELVSRGLKFFRGHDGSNISSETQAVVASSAIEPSNIELECARSRGMPVYRRSDALGVLMRGHRGVAVAGTAGKSTTTAMLGHILKEVGLSPTVALGARALDFEDGNFLIGTGQYFVAEADEYDRSFLTLPYEIGVITHYVFGDHVDYYGDESEMRAAFCDFANKVGTSGSIVACTDFSQVDEIVQHSNSTVISYGFSGNPNWRIASAVTLTCGTEFEIVSPNGKRLSGLLKSWGKHNVLNATGALATAVAFGVDTGAALSALRTFQGCRRRIELIGSRNGALVFDDFGHNVAQIAATLRALSDSHHDAPMLCVFQPRQYRRTLLFKDDIAKAFHGVHEVVVMDISRGLGDTEELASKIHSRDLVSSMSKSGVNARYLATEADVLTYLESTQLQGLLVVTLGTGDVYRIAHELVRRGQQ